jgi:hypothetical protein
MVPVSSTVMCTRPARPQRSALTGGVRSRRSTDPQQPFGQRGVQAAGDRILDRGAIGGGKGSHLEGRWRSLRVGAHDAQVEVHLARPQRQDGLGTLEQGGDPARTIVHPLGIHDLGALHP